MKYKVTNQAELEFPYQLIPVSMTDKQLTMTKEIIAATDKKDESSKYTKLTVTNGYGNDKANFYLHTGPDNNHGWCLKVKYVHLCLKKDKSIVVQDYNDYKPVIEPVIDSVEK